MVCITINYYTLQVFKYWYCITDKLVKKTISVCNTLPLKSKRGGTMSVAQAGDAVVDASKSVPSSAMTDIVAFARGAIVVRKDVNRKKDTWKPDQPIARADKKGVEGLWCWTPKCPKDPWVQALDDMPEGTLSDFVVKEAAGNFDISCTYPKKELWQDYIETCEKAAAAADGQAEGELPCCTIVVS